MKKLLIYSSIISLAIYPTVVFFILIYKINTKNNFSYLGFGFETINNKVSIIFDYKILITIPIMFILTFVIFMFIKLIFIIMKIKKRIKKNTCNNQNVWYNN